MRKERRGKREETGFSTGVNTDSLSLFSLLSFPFPKSSKKIF